MSDATPTPFTFAGMWGWKQPPVSETQLREARTALLRYRIMAFTTGVILIAGCVALILKYATTMDVEPWTGYLWVAHGWLFLVYVVMTLLLAVRLRWPLARAAVVMLAGTVPTMSFIAEHFVTRSARQAAGDRATAQPVDVRD